MKNFENPFPTKKDFVFKNPFPTKEDIVYPIGMFALLVINFLFGKSLPSLILLVWGVVCFSCMFVANSKVRRLFINIGLILVPIILWLSH